MQKKDGIVISNTELSSSQQREVLQHCAYTDSNGSVCNGSFCELSVYDCRPATHNQIVEECAVLLTMFPNIKDSFFLMLHRYIENSEMSVERLRAAVSRLITEHKYNTFTVADILGYDKTIIVADSVSTLRYIVRNSSLDYGDMVVVRGKVNGNERKMYAVKYEVESSPYKSRIIGTWNSHTHSWNVLGQVNDNTIQQRKDSFRQSLFEFCDYPPRYMGKYNVQLVGKFYDYYSQVVGFGDMLRYEQYMSWDMESALEKWCKLGKQAMESGRSKLNAKAEDVTEITSSEALRNKLTLQVIAENMSIYQRMSPQIAEKQMTELINKRLQENGINP